MHYDMCYPVQAFIADLQPYWSFIEPPTPPQTLNLHDSDEGDADEGSKWGPLARSSPGVSDCKQQSVILIQDAKQCGAAGFGDEGGPHSKSRSGDMWYIPCNNGIECCCLQLHDLCS